MIRRGFWPELILILLSFLAVSEAKEELTARQIVDLVLASKERYKTFEIQMTEEGFKLLNGKPAPQPDQVNDITWRSSGTRTYVELKHASSGNLNGQLQDTEVYYRYAINDKWSKRCIERATSKPRGLVNSGRSFEGELGVTILDAIWGIFHHDWEDLAGDQTQVTFDENSNCYVLTWQRRPTSSIIRVVIDPSLDFLPIKYVVTKANGEFAVKLESSDFRKTAGDLWLPYKYVFETRSYISIHRLKNAKINIPLQDQQLDFSFPAGTLVNDRIANLKHVIDSQEVDEDTTISVSPDTAETVDLAHIAGPDHSAKDATEPSDEGQSKESIVSKSDSSRKSHRSIYTVSAVCILIICFLLPCSAYVIRRRRDSRQI
jgi:hypothetical protein